MPIKRWAVTVEGEVAGTISIDSDNPLEAAQRLCAAYDSDPKIIPINLEDSVGFGWTWDGEKFNPPVA